MSPDEIIDLVKKFKSDIQMDSINTPFNLTNLNYSNTTPITIKAEETINTNGLINNKFDINENLISVDNNEAIRNADEFKTKSHNADIDKN